MAQLMFEHIPRRILVTGGGTGIGLGIVKRLRELDCGVVAVGRRLQPLEQAAHFGAEVQQWDITSNQAELLRRIGPVDGLVLNAGQFIYEPVSAWTESTWTQLWRVNTLAAAMLAHEFSEQLDGPGAIVAVASTLAHRPAPGAAPTPRVKRPWWPPFSTSHLNSHRVAYVRMSYHRGLCPQR